MDITTKYEPERSNWAGWMEAFSIMEKYDEGKFGVGAEHDEVYVYLDPAGVSDEDKARLDELGWTPVRNDGFRKYT